MRKIIIVAAVVVIALGAGFAYTLYKVGEGMHLHRCGWRQPDDSGDLKETIEKAEKELKEKEGTTQWLFLKWQYDNARKAFEKYNRRLEDLKDFIKLAKEELAKREEAAGHGRDNTNP